MPVVSTRRGTVTVEPDALILHAHPLTHARRLLESWHGPVWLLVLAALLHQGPFTPVSVASSLLLAGGAYLAFIAGMWLLRFHDLPIPRTTRIPKDAITGIVPRIGMNRETWHTTTLFDIEHGTAITTVAPLDDTRFDALLEEHNYPYEY